MSLFESRIDHEFVAAVQSIARELKKLNETLAKKDGGNEPREVFVYKEYCDEDCYLEEEVLVFDDLEKARMYLVSRVEGFCGCEWEVIPKNFSADELEVFGPDKVEIVKDCGATHYWVIEDKPVK